MATEQVQLVFSGEGTQGGQIDGRKLGEALVAFTLMLDAAKATDPALKGTELRLTITSTAEGSFDIQAILEGMGTAWDAFAAWAEGRNGAASTQLQGFLVTVLTVLALIRDRRPREQSDEAFVETLPDGTRRAYSSEALKILQSGPFLRAARDVVEVLDEDVNRLEVVTDTENVVLEAADRPAFRDAALEAADPVEETTVRETTVTPAVGVFRGTGKWKVQEYGSTYSATMADDDFIKLVQEDDWPVTKADEYRVRVASVARTTPTGRRTWDNTITHVLGYRKAPGQPFRTLPQPRNKEGFFPDTGVGETRL